MDENDMTFLEKSLINNNNKNISNLTFYNINKNKISIIDNLQLTKKDTNLLLKQLKDYQYIDELPDLVEGRYIRWINIINPYNIKLTNGGILCEIKIEDYVTLVMKNRMNRFFQINLDENLIFQRLTDQEKIILYAIDLANK
ncbi:hypothetical protein ceV_370 [Chrysochromulina ericina virus CeV-01B]|jgi:hypothetical protein|uniref:Uncharacterized protein n=1 Tax=Chrysochromulina ericina virus CeV-01B TaxID=3070830 RepID=A0A0N9R1G0_9VIRU|nr:hypothetical protein ceV_370 [Chrysochromulina ericina virus]ALH23276.1 hypothetical protein ceV_370 [Chrysochromulina ericina virus CeV-01B]|tara:strand:+ start:21989 stop:22414 length:426 start_codon:yes stop_codon:yes gene_type:complete